MNMLWNWRFGLILLAALLLRMLWLDWVPARLTVDEMSIGYNAYSIIKTGKDEWGRTLPLIFEAFGDHKLPIYIYLTAPLVGLLGLSIWSVKLVSVLAGIGFMILMMLIAQLLTKDERAGWWTGLVVAVTPWAIHLSRQALESHVALFLFSLALYLLMRFRDKKQSWIPMMLVGVLLGLTGYTYIAYRALIVLMIPLLIWWVGVRRTAQWGAIVAGLLLIWLPLLPQFFSTSGLARAKQTSLFTDPGIEAAVIDKRSFCFLVEPKLNPVCTLLFNKVTEIGNRWAGNYLSFFSSEFLFVSGDKNLYLNHPDFGEYLWIFLPLLILGRGASILDMKKRGLLLGLLLLAPLPASFSGSAQMVRSSALLLPLSLIMGLGAWRLFGLWSDKSYGWVRMLMLGLMGIMILQFLVSYFVIYPTKFDNAAYQLPTSVARFVEERHSNYTDGVLVDHRFSDAHMFLAFYLGMDPAWYQGNVERPQTDGLGFSHPTKLGNYRFGIESFEEAYCKEGLTDFLFISPDAVSVTLPNGERVGYATQEYFNFSGVHPQARVIESTGLRAFLDGHETSREEFCK